MNKSQSPKESTRLLASKFQTLRRQAGIQDGLSLVLTFWVELIAKKILEALSASLNKTSASLYTNASKYVGENNYERNHKRTALAQVNEDFKSSKTILTSSPSAKNSCFYCSQPWYHGHRCEEFVEVKNKE
ncbi:hypothetical protein EDC96DRAFT_607481 [Choanephora cucurbitarum]|nr:hypothetical protein EDC96DRAFT_607481 [Choanephora cucurbitarum]